MICNHMLYNAHEQQAFVVYACYLPDKWFFNKYIVQPVSFGKRKHSPGQIAFYHGLKQFWAIDGLFLARLKDASGRDP